MRKERERRKKREFIKVLDLLIHTGNMHKYYIIDQNKHNAEMHRTAPKIQDFSPIFKTTFKIHYFSCEASSNGIGFVSILYLLIVICITMKPL